MTKLIEWPECRDNHKWALDKAAKEMGYNDYSEAARWLHKKPLLVVQKLARFYATYEQEPIPDDLRVARECVRDSLHVVGQVRMIDDDTLPVKAAQAAYNRGKQDAQPKWIEHDGGECPVDGEAVVVEHQCGVRYVASQIYCRWHDVVRYFILPEPEAKQ